jgi:hypothetical protein
VVDVGQGGGGGDHEARAQPSGCQQEAREQVNQYRGVGGQARQQQGARCGQGEPDRCDRPWPQVADGAGGEVAAADGGQCRRQEHQPGVQGGIAEQTLQVQGGQEVGGQQQAGGGQHDQLAGQQRPASQ